MKLKKMISLLRRFFTDRDSRVYYLSMLGCYDSLPDEKYLKQLYRCLMHKELDLESPRTFNEKMQWLKLNDHNPKYTGMVDKYEVKKYVASVIGEKYIIPTLGVWDDPEKIDFDRLPDQFVLKCNHNSGLGICICGDKDKLNIRKAKRELKKGLAQNYYLLWREWPYKNVKRRIIAEKYLTDGNSGDLMDYKFYCFSGRAEYVLVCTDRSSGSPKYYFFDRNWRFKRYNKWGIQAPEGFTIPKPRCMDEMFEIAERLSQNHLFIRVDLYCVNEKVYFGELTFYPNSGFDRNRLPEVERMFGSKVDLKLARGK